MQTYKKYNSWNEMYEDYIITEKTNNVDKEILNLFITNDTNNIIYIKY